ncbi:MAG: hypothetical protein AAF492_11270, partial [Verrucomicrobiota bacterium]
GYMPMEYFGRRHAWCLILNPKKFKELGRVHEGSVRIHKLKKKGDPYDSSTRDDEVPLDYFNIDTNGYGVPRCIVFRPEGDVNSGDRFLVEIDNIRKSSGKRIKHAYVVEFFRL